MKHTLTMDVDERAVVAALVLAVNGLPDADARHLLDRIEATEAANPRSLFRLLPADPGKDKPLRVAPSVAMNKLGGL